MNPQPEPYVGNIFAVLFVLYTGYLVVKTYRSNTSNIENWDLFTIGYIDDKIHNTNTTVIVNEVCKRINFESEQIYLDCIDALHALGMKKSAAKKKTKEIFSSMDNLPNSVQDFLMIALRRN